MKKSKKKGMNAKNVISTLVIALLIGAAIKDQLDRPAGERTWHGEVFGLPYDFRVPTIERLRAAYWNPDTSQILTPQPFGIGWTINFYPLLHRENLRLGA